MLTFIPGTGHHTDEITLELTRVVIALSVFAVGVELPRWASGSRTTARERVN